MCALLLKESETSQIFQLGPLCHGCQGLPLRLEGFSHQNFNNNHNHPLFLPHFASDLKRAQTFHLMAGNSVTARFLQLNFPVFSFTVFSFTVFSHS